MTRGGEDVDPTDVGLAAVPEPGEVIQRPPEPPADPPATPEAVRRFLAEIRAAQGWDDERSQVEREALNRPCPHCHASVWERCVSVAAHHRPRKPFTHEARLGGGDQ